MAESPQERHEEQEPDTSDLPQVLTFPKERNRVSAWLGRRSPLSLVFGLIVLGAVTVWGVRSWSADGPDAQADRDTFTVPPTAPATSPPTTRAGGPEPEVPPTEIEATVATTVELEVRPRDDAGNLLPDTLVRFTVESGTGTLEVDTARTDASGTASTLVTLAAAPEVMVVVASVIDAERPPVRITVTGRLGPPQRIVKVYGDGRVTDAGGLLEDFVIEVLDGADNPVPGVEVFFRPDPANGVAVPSGTLSDALGRAYTTWRLGPDAGVQRLDVEVEGGTTPSVTFTATALGDPAAASDVEPSEEDTVQSQSPEVEPVPEVEPAPVVVVRRTFDIGGTFVCSLASGRAACRGADDRGQLGGGGGGGFESLAVGVSHACALDDSGAARCWGANDGGQLGDGSRTDRAAPVPVETDARFSVLAAGAGHTCGLLSDGRAACWGRNLSGQLGDGTRDDHTTPEPLPGNRSFQSLVAGWEHTCGLSAGGELACWGSNGQGQLGDGSRVDRLTPTAVTGSFGSVVAGSRHTCGISGERVRCWGDNSFGQLGDGSTQARTRPTEVVGLPAPPVRLAAGAVHTCALLEDGGAWCWGQNVHGQVGDGTNENRAAPSRVVGGLTFRSLFAGGALTCGFTPGGNQYCWGLNQTGQLGDGTRVNRASPARVGG